MAIRSLKFTWLDVELLLARIGWLPFLALILLATAAALAFVALPELQQQTDKIDRNLSDLRAGRLEMGADEQLSIRYRNFRSQLAQAEERGALLKTLFKKASDNGLNLAQGEYRLQDVADCKCEQLQISLPLRGTYSQIRAFVNSALGDIPSLALTEISFRRDSVKTAVLESRLSLTLYLRKGE